MLVIEVSQIGTGAETRKIHERTARLIQNVDRVITSSGFHGLSPWDRAEEVDRIRDVAGRLLTAWARRRKELRDADELSVDEQIEADELAAAVDAVIVNLERISDL